MNLEDSFTRLLIHEAGYTPGKGDPGGETNFGISKRSYPNEDIKGMTLTRALEIYQKDFWIPAGCDALPDAIRFDVFDMAVNSGVKAAIKNLQAAVGETRDGIVGPRTMRAMHNMPAEQLLARFNGHRLEFMSNLKNWPIHGRGWARRIAANLKEV